MSRQISILFAGASPDHGCLAVEKHGAIEDGVWTSSRCSALVELPRGSGRLHALRGQRLYTPLV